MTDEMQTLVLSLAGGSTGLALARGAGPGTIAATVTDTLQSLGLAPS